MNKTQEALRKAHDALILSLPQISSDYRTVNEALFEIDEALAELALQEMADNAKELGLDYCNHGSDSACKECYRDKTK